MGKKLFVLTIIIKLFIFTISSSTILSAKPINEEGEILYPPVAYSPPKIDGILDDEIWKNSPLEKDFITYNPLYGEILPQKTQVWIAYDSKNLYFAFMCYDTEPQKIKTSITKRDNTFFDDWVGLSLDALGNKQTSYDLFVNPNGIQADILNSAVGGENLSADFVWESAGRVTNEGYQVEIRIPLRSIRFKNSKEVKMGILFWRSISRLGMSGSWPDLPPGQGFFTRQATVIYRDLKSPLILEMLPSTTFGASSERVNPKEWDKDDSFKDIGIGLKYGITSSIITDITINPDFSQVESDAFQVEVNQRYPIFYSEKRPFFMEGTDIFDFSTPSNYFYSAVHTRRIVDPLWGTKLTGTVGKTSFGIITAGDESPGREFEEDKNPNEGKNAYFTIFRGKRSLSQDNFIGGIYSGREFASGYNRVAGADFGYRFLKNHQILTSFLQSISRESEEEANIKSPNFNFVYTYDTKPLFIGGLFNHIGKDFRMDSAFLRRTGINDMGGQININFYPNPKKLPWLKRITSFVAYKYLHDLDTKMDDTDLHFGQDFIFTKHGSLEITYTRNSESWKNQTFNLAEYNLNGGVQITKWLSLVGEFGKGGKINYDADPPYKGDGYGANFSFTLQPNTKLNLSFDFNYNDLYKDKEKIYDVNIINSRTTYQFNKYFFIRGVLQYDSYQKRMLLDFLSSFTFIPGTVLHLGYGGLYENRKWQDNEWQYKQGDLLNIKRSFFFKASYLWRF